VVNSQEKLIMVEEIFLDISKHMLKTSYTLNLEQSLKIAHELKIYFWQNLKLEKTYNLSRATTDKQVGSLVPELGIVAITIDNHMAMIQV